MKSVASAIAFTFAAVVLVALPEGASAGDSAIQVQGAVVRISRTERPNPARCGPFPAVERMVTAEGVDSLGGSFTQNHSFCRLRQGGVNMTFDYTGTKTYIATGESATITRDDSVTVSDFENCFAQPLTTNKLTFTDFTGKHAGGRFKGRADFAADACTTTRTPPIAWYYGVFTPNAP